MKKIYLLTPLLIFLVSIMSVNNVHAAFSPFHFDDSKIDVGSLYHYIASDINGKNPIDVYLYIKSKDTIIIYKDYSKTLNEVLIMDYVFDWKHMMGKSYYSYNPLNTKHLPGVGVEYTQTVDFNKKKIKIKSVENNKSGKPMVYNFLINYRKEPCFDYGPTFHFDLQFAFRFLKDSARNFSIGNNVMQRYVESDVKYIKTETINHIICKKYEIKAHGLLGIIFNAKGYLWIADKDPRHYMVKYMNYQQKNKMWRNFKLELWEIKKMSEAEWEHKKNQMIEQANKEVH